MRRLALYLLWAGAALAAVDGRVVNRTTGKPQPGATVTLYAVGGSSGMQALGSARSDAQGKFSINQPAEGTHLLQTAFEGVSYSHMLSPGTPSTGLELEVFNASRQPGQVKLDQHILVLEPSGQRLSVSESFFFTNAGKVTYNDPDGGTLRFVLPEKAEGEPRVTAQAPRGVPVPRSAEKTGEPNVYKVNFPVKPGETRFDISYSLPFTDPGVFSGQLLYKGAMTKVAAPSGVTVKADGLEALGPEPSTNASLYTVKGDSYSLELQGSGALRSSEPAGDDAGPAIEQILPRVYENLPWILGPTLLILALGFVLLYRRPAPAPVKDNRRG